MSIADILRIIRNPTVDSVLASFRTAADDLRAINVARADEALGLFDRKRALEARIAEAQAEGNRALAVAERIESLIK